MRNEDGIPLVSPFAELRAENERLRAAIADVLEHREAKWSSWGRIVHEAALRRLEQVFKREKEGGVTKQDEPLLGLATTRQLLEELAVRMEVTQNSIKGRDLGRLCREAVDNLDRGVLDYRTVGPWGPLAADERPTP